MESGLRSNYMSHRIIFFGTSEFAAPALNALARDGRFEIAGVVTQPDRAVGRHATLTPPAVKAAAMKLGITTIQQPEKLKEESFTSWIKTEGPACDAFVVISYGKILPRWLLDLPRMGVVNVHGSLLPRWRGASPIQAAIAAGDAKTGVSFMLLDELLDHGPVLSAVETPIHPDDTGGALHDRLALLGAKHLPDTLASFLKKMIQPKEQDHTAATTCGILMREHGRMDWSETADVIARHIRAYQPWPGTWTTYAGERLKIHEASAIMGDESFSPGQGFVFEGFPSVACGDGTALVLRSVQREGKSPASGQDFLHGHAGWESVHLG